MLEQDEGEDSSATEPESASSTDKETPATAEEASETIPDELPTDSNWDDVFDTGATSYSAPEGGDNRDIFETLSSNGEGLHEHLTWQLELTNFTDSDRHIGRTIIDSIDEDGYLPVSTEDIFNSLDKRLEIEHDEVEAVLHRIQQFDPIGVGARNLQESLQLQLRQFDASTPWMKQAKILVRDYFTALSNRDYSKLARKLKLSTEKLQQVLGLIQSLGPRSAVQASRVAAGGWPVAAGASWSDSDQF